MNRFYILVFILGLAACEEEKNGPELSVSRLKNSSDIINYLSQNKLALITRKNADAPIKIKHFYNQAVKLNKLVSRLNSELELLVRKEKPNRETISKYNEDVLELNNFLDSLYLNFGYPEYYNISTELDYPLDSATYLLCQIELYRIFNVGLNSIISQEQSMITEPYFTSNVMTFSNSDSVIKLGEGFSLHIIRGHFEQLPTNTQKLGEIKLWRNNNLLKDDYWDTINTNTSIKKILFKPKEKGIYKWEIEYHYLKPNGLWYTDTVGSQFKVDYIKEGAK